MSSAERISLDYGNTIVSARNVTKAYAGKVAVENVSFDIDPGQFVLFSGYSGSGKSTMLSMIEGIVTPDSGSVGLLGQTITGMRQHKLDRLKRDHVGVGFQAPLIDRSFTVVQNIKLAAEANGRRVSNNRIVELANRFNMEDKLFQQAGGLSGGEQMRVSLMRTMATNPDLLLFDEPVGALNDKGKEEVHTLLRDLVDTDGKTILMVSQDANITREFADRELIMDNGRLASDLSYARSNA